MRIGLNEIDPVIAQALLERLGASSNEFLKDDIAWGGFFNRWRLDPNSLSVKRKRDPTEDEKAAYELRQKREEQLVLRIIFGATTLPLVAGSGLGVALATMTNYPPMGVMAGLTTWLAGTAAGVYWTLRATPKARLERAVQPVEMKAVFPLLTLTRAERIYCDTLLLLANMEVPPGTEATIRDTLQQINRLLDSHRQLVTRRQSLLPVLGMNPVKELEAEYGELGRRLDLTTDSSARKALQQSLAMCATRLQNARAFEQGLERLKAQEEAILQTLSSAQTALARMQLIPETQSGYIAQEITASVDQMNQQTYAVEKAVEEVMTLRQT